VLVAHQDSLDEMQALARPSGYYLILLEVEHLFEQYSEPFG
jgi:hypothetical protein